MWIHFIHNLLIACYWFAGGTAHLRSTHKSAIFSLKDLPDVFNNPGGKKASMLWSTHRRIVLDTPYPLTKAVSTEKGLRYRIGIISDLDLNSKTSSGKWISYMRRGNLFLQYKNDEPKLSTVIIWIHTYAVNASS